MDYGQSIYGNLSIALLQKNDTGVSPWYSYKLFCICCSVYQKMTNLTMLFNVLLTKVFFKWLQVMLQINPFQVVYLFSNKIYNLPRLENCLVFSVFKMDNSVCKPCNLPMFVREKVLFTADLTIIKFIKKSISQCLLMFWAQSTVVLSLKCKAFRGSKAPALKWLPRRSTPGWPGGALLFWAACSGTEADCLMS